MTTMLKSPDGTIAYADGISDKATAILMRPTIPCRPEEMARLQSLWESAVKNTDLAGVPVFVVSPDVELHVLYSEAQVSMHRQAIEETRFYSDGYKRFVPGDTSVHVRVNHPNMHPAMVLSPQEGEAVALAAASCCDWVSFIERAYRAGVICNEQRAQLEGSRPDFNPARLVEILCQRHEEPSPAESPSECTCPGIVLLHGECQCGAKRGAE